MPIYSTSTNERLALKAKYRVVTQKGEVAQLDVVKRDSCALQVALVVVSLHGAFAHLREKLAFLRAPLATHPAYLVEDSRQ